MYALRVVSLVLTACNAGAQFRDTSVIANFRRADPKITEFRTIVRYPLDSGYTLLLVVGSARKINDARERGFYWGPDTLMGLLQISTAKPERLWELAMIHDPDHESFAQVERMDANSIVISREDGDYGTRKDSLKFFFDSASHRLIRIAPFTPASVTALYRNGGSVYFTTLNAQGSVGEDAPRLVPGAVPPMKPAAEISAPAGMPVSTDSEIRRARPDHQQWNEVGEKIGPMQRFEGKLWFAKTFYDGEGSTGAGGFGYFDRASGKFTMFSPAALAGWSASALLVEDDAVWIGVCTNPEGASVSGGLLRYDRASGNTTRFATSGIITAILRKGDALDLGSSEGLYIWRDGKLSHFVIEPALNGSPAIFRQER
ncbi:MAG: hypothetical protein JWO80_47 [Bryobacterales bacterium]|nr:hypothetical protein [Bryobacterales bacterium]